MFPRPHTCGMSAVGIFFAGACSGWPVVQIILTTAAALITDRQERLFLVAGPVFGAGHTVGS